MGSPFAEAEKIPAPVVIASTTATSLPLKVFMWGSDSCSNDVASPLQAALYLMEPVVLKDSSIFAFGHRLPLESTIERVMNDRDGVSSSVGG